MTRSGSRRQALREAFAEQIGELQMEVGGEHSRMVGVVLAPAAHSTRDPHDGKMPAPTASDRKAIGELMRNWHSLHPQDAAKQWRRYATSPYYTYGRGGVTKVTGPTIGKMLKSADFKRVMGAFQPYRKRQARVSNVRVTFIGRGFASVTYRVTEKGKARTAVGTGAAFVKRDRRGWKINVISHLGALK